MSGGLVKIVFLNSGLTAIRNWLGGSDSSRYPQAMIWGTSSTDANFTDSAMSSVLIGKEFISTDLGVTSQIQWEALLGSLDVTGSTIRQVAIGELTTGTSGIVYIIEDISDIEKSSYFDLQTLVIAEVVRGNEI